MWGLTTEEFQAWLNEAIDRAVQKVMTQHFGPSEIESLQSSDQQLLSLITAPSKQPSDGDSMPSPLQHASEKDIQQLTQQQPFISSTIQPSSFTVFPQHHFSEQSSNQLHYMFQVLAPLQHYSSSLSQPHLSPSYGNTVAKSDFIASYFGAASFMITCSIWDRMATPLIWDYKKRKKHTYSSKAMRLFEGSSCYGTTWGRSGSTEATWLC